MIRTITITAIVIGLAAAAGGAMAIAQSPPAPNTEDSKIICKYVVAAGSSRDNKPFRMCQSKADWALKEAQDSKDANRIVCKYQENPSSPYLKGYKICQPASEWAEQERLTREHFLLIQQGASPPH
jgi:hypothetical protein